ncbi:MAG: tRNA (cytidine(34)-2'-O)-methyltransferase [Oscillospiraceae bacterium]|nr:tRNA (cytidine(34)-2'-O)-methyltransferase [Oscillospiraceae bacterium]
MNKFLNIVLLQPQIPQNTGNIARTVAAIGINLHIVQPIGFEITDKKLKRAGLDYWDKLSISIYSSTEKFFSTFEDEKKKIYIFFTTKGKKLYSDFDYINCNENIFLIFGREDAGIDEQLLLSNKENCARIPMLNNIRSLNLSNSVNIACYEVLRQRKFPNLLQNGNLDNL